MTLARENIHVPSGEERGETDVFAGYNDLWIQAINRLLFGYYENSKNFETCWIVWLVQIPNSYNRMVN